MSCYLYYPVIPNDMNLTVTAAYINGKGIPVVLTNVTTLPLRLIVKPCLPIKEADYKVTVSTNKPAVSLLDLFPGNEIVHFQTDLSGNTFNPLNLRAMILQNLSWIAPCPMRLAFSILEVRM